MTYILALLLMGPLAATGIYNPQVMRHGHCTAEPGTFLALYCPPATAPAHRPRRR